MDVGQHMGQLFRVRYLVEQIEQLTNSLGPEPLLKSIIGRSTSIDFIFNMLNN